MKNLLVIFTILRIYSVCCLPVRLNLQTLSFDGETILLEVLQSDDSCHYFLAEIYTNGTASPNFTINSTGVLQISTEALVNNYLRVTARHQNGSICAADRSLYTLYHFPSDGNFAAGIIPTLEADDFVTVSLSTAHCLVPVVQWPKNFITNGENCHCFPIEDNSYSFSSCAESCETDYQVSLSTNGSALIFYNLSRAPGDFLVHFMCDNQLCTTEDSCFHVSVLSASYKIKVETGSVTTGMSRAKYTKHEITLLSATIAATFWLLCWI